jgi:hypothetical protein
MLWIGTFPAMAAVNDEKSAVPEKKWSAELQLKRYFRSHTSFEFGNPHHSNPKVLGHSRNEGRSHGDGPHAG